MSQPKRRPRVGNIVSVGGGALVGTVIGLGQILATGTALGVFITSVIVLGLCLASLLAAPRSRRLRALAAVGLAASLLSTAGSGYAVVVKPAATGGTASATTNTTEPSSTPTIVSSPVETTATAANRLLWHQEFKLPYDSGVVLSGNTPQSGDNGDVRVARSAGDSVIQNNATVGGRVDTDHPTPDQCRAGIIASPLPSRGDLIPVQDGDTICVAMHGGHPRLAAVHVVHISNDSGAIPFGVIDVTVWADES